MTYFLNDRELVRKIRGGDIFAFEKLFKKYYTRLCVFAEDYLKEPALAEEIVAELFTNLWEKRNKLPDIVNLNAYLYRSVHNNCLLYLERLKLLKKYKEFAVTEIQRKQLMYDGDNSYPLANLISQEIESKIEEAIDSLPERCREIFCMHRFEDETYESISLKLGISINTVRTQMMRAMDKLRESLKEYLPPQPGKRSKDEIKKS